MSHATALERARLVIRGVRAELALEDGRITITKESPPDRAARTVSFDVERVRGSTLQLPPRGGRGWLHVAVAGGSPVPPGELAAAGDPYTLPIATRSTRAARRFSRLVEKHVRERGMPKEAGPNEGRYSSGVSLTEPPAGARGSHRPARPSDPTSLSDRAGLSDRARASDPAGPSRGGSAEVGAGRPDPIPVRRSARDPAGASAPGRSSAPGGSTRRPAQILRIDEPEGDDDRERAAGRLVVYLRELAELHEAGVLNDDEFERAKARLLR